MSKFIRAMKIQNLARVSERANSFGEINIKDESDILNQENHSFFRCIYSAQFARKRAARSLFPRLIFVGPRREKFNLILTNCFDFRAEKEGEKRRELHKNCWSRAETYL